MAVLQRIVKGLEGLEVLDRLGSPLASASGRVTRPTPVKNALSGTWLGHQLHPMLSDVPIGAWLAAGMLDLTGGAWGTRAARRLVGLGVLAALPTAAAGISDWSETYGSEQRVGLVHGLGNLAATGLQSASYLARRRGRRGTAVTLSVGALGIMTAAGYLGGHLSFNRGVGVNHTAFEEAVAEWTDVAALAELASDKPVRVVAGGVPVVLVRQGGEQVYALSATCVHAGGPLDEGEVVDGCLRCPWHASAFRLSDGKVMRGPAPIDQPAWEVRVEGERVQVRTAGH
ncbi:MAG: Rieske 2Fe-2S domain-containing protein [Acidimicrobiales bacterium]